MEEDASARSVEAVAVVSEPPWPRRARPAARQHVVAPPRKARRVQLLLLSVLTLVALPCTNHKAEEQRAILAEARFLVLLLARSGLWAYERERLGEYPESGATEARFAHEVCLAAPPIPDRVPVAGERIRVDERLWSSGDIETGWKCLKADPRRELPVQLTYLKSTRSKVHARGGGELGAEAFEVCAEVDLIAGGDTSLLCRWGVIGAQRRLRLSNAIEYLEVGL